MVEILHELPIKAPPAGVFEAVSRPQGLDRWWTQRCEGTPVEGAEYRLWFGPDHDWRARVSRCLPDAEFELEILDADEDWKGTRVGFRIEAREDATWVGFRHAGWPSANRHYRVSCTCWGLYLRLLRRYLEHGESVAYAGRLEA